MTPRTFLNQSILPLMTAVLCFTLPATQTAYAAVDLLPTEAQQTQNTTAPVPDAVLHAKKLFLVAPVWDSAFSQNTNDLAVRFTTSIADCCGYTIVSTPDHADLLVQLHGAATQRNYTVDGSNSVETDRDLQIEFLDPTTQVPLWTVASAVQGAYIGVTQAQALDASLDALVLKLKPLGTPQGTVTTTATTRVAAPKAPLPAGSEEATARTRLQTAHSVYLQLMPPDTDFPADPNLAFATFTQDMTTWGHYTLATSAASSDMVLQFQAIAETSDPSSAGTPYFKLTLVDPATQRALWVITLPAQLGQGKHHVDLYSQSVQNVVAQVKLLSGQALTKQESASLTPQASWGSRHVGLIIGLSLGVPALIATGVILAHQGHKSTPTPYCPFPAQPTLCA